MRTHISIFMFLFAAVGLAGGATPLTTVNGGYYFVEKTYKDRDITRMSINGEGKKLSAQNVAEGVIVTFKASPDKGMKIVDWGTCVGPGGGSAIQQYNNVNWTGRTLDWYDWQCKASDNGYGYLAVRFDYIPLNVTFNGNGGTGSMDPISGLNIISNFTLTANSFTKTGYHFIGWKTNQTSDVIFKDKAQVKGSDLWNGKSFNSTFYAQWATNTYTVHFDGNGATGGSMDDESFAYDETKALTANAFMKTGFAFDGWATNATEGAVLYKDKASVKNLTTNDNATVTLYARWTAGDYTVTFDANGGGTPSPSLKEVSYGSTYGTLATCSRNGYSLDGWYTEKSGGTKITADTTVTITGAQTLYAHWTPVTYTITYDYKQGTAPNPNPTTYTIESDDIVFQPPSEVPGYKFDKWAPPSIPKGSTTGDKTVRASYLTISYRPKVHSPLTYDGYAQACFQQPLPTGVVAETPGEARVVGTYTTTFRPTFGYCWDDGTTEPYVVDWQIVNAEIVVNEIRQSGSLTYTGEPQQPQVYARATVKGGQTVTWKYSTSQGGYTETMPSFTDAGSYTVYFEASAPNHDPATGSFAVKIDRAKMAAVTVTPTSLPYTRKKQGPTVTVQHCHEAADSVKRATDVGTYAVKATPDENYAWSNGETAAREFMWSIDDSLYTVQFDGNGGTGEMASTNLAYNEEYVVPECAFTKTGCEFQRWQVLIDNRAVTNYLAGTLVSNLTTVAGKVVTFKAEWLGRYTIAFDKNGGEGEMASTNVERDVGFQLPSNAFTRTGYDFTTWTTNLSASIKPADLIADGATVTNLVAAGETCTLHALWDAHRYTITFDANGGKGEMTSHGLAYDEPYTLPECTFAAPKFCTFLYWSTSATDASTVYHAGETVSNLTAEADGTVPLYAIWKYDVGPWSNVLDCKNLMFFNDTEKDPAHKWEVVQEGVPGTTSTESAMHNKLGIISILYAELDESGTISYCWKGEGSGYSDDPNYLSVCTNDIEVCRHNMVDDTGWTTNEFHVDVVPGKIVTIQFKHNDPCEAYLDCVTWTPDGGEEPTPGEPVEVTAASVEGNVFSLTISTVSGTDYGVWTNADLTVDSWGLMGEPQKGEGDPLEFKWTILPEFPQLFFRAHKVEYK